MSNGLKVMLLTTHGKLVVIEAHNFIAGQSVREMMEGMSSKYELDSFDFTSIYPVNGVIAVEFNSRYNCNLLKSTEQQQAEHSSVTDTLKKGLVILKVQNNSFALSKVINLYLDPK
jgi:hypothetical protein